MTNGKHHPTHTKTTPARATEQTRAQAVSTRAGAAQGAKTQPATSRPVKV